MSTYRRGNCGWRTCSWVTLATTNVNSQLTHLLPSSSPSKSLVSTSVVPCVPCRAVHVYMFWFYYYYYVLYNLSKFIRHFYSTTHYAIQYKAFWKNTHSRRLKKWSLRLNSIYTSIHLIQNMCVIRCINLYWASVNVCRVDIDWICDDGLRLFFSDISCLSSHVLWFFSTHS